MDIQTLSKMYYLQTMVEVAKAEIEAMKAANTERISRDESLAYTEKDFMEIRKGLIDLATQLHAMTY
jgi:hypothetical protein